MAFNAFFWLGEAQPVHGDEVLREHKLIFNGHYLFEVGFFIC